MARQTDLTGENMTRQRRKDRQYGTKTDLSSTTVDRGDTHWMNSSRVSIDGVLDVTGLTTISGTLNVSGTTTLSGSTTIAGPTGITGALTIAGSMSVTGPSTFTGTLGINGATTIAGKLDVTGPTKLAGTLDITGNTKITGLLDITGKTTIRNDLELLSGGMFKAGVTKIEPTGKATFGSFIIDPASDRLIQAPGGWLFTDGLDSLGLASSGSSSVNLNSSYAELNYKGSSVVRAEAGTINLNAPQTSVNGNLVGTGTAKLTALTTGAAGTPANIHIDSSGRLWRANP
ncbi:hypothetical protein CGQ24_07415 [Arthrobacter sp. 7749]|nr:hypothetical protein CGQ24_07415 [Arthrobacter sp. 7749]